MRQIRLYPSGAAIPCADGDTVLVALERAGYALPNNCRAGACGECKVRVRSGQFDQGFVLDMALSQEERKQGYGLMCMAKPLSPDLEIEWGTVDAKPRLFPPREAQAMILTDRIQRTPRITEFVLRPLGDIMRYWPGQYVQLGDPSDGVPLRSYSLSNAPRADGEIKLQVTRVDGGRTSQWLHDKVQLGDSLRVSGPYGTFIGDPSVDTPVLCLAAGSGLAPILSLTEAALKRGYRRPVDLLFSGQTQADLYDLGLMRFWEARHSNFRYLATLTREQVNGFQHGRIPGLLPTLFPDLSQHSIFISGTPAFVEDCVSSVKALGAQDALLHTEGFFVQA